MKYDKPFLKKLYNLIENLIINFEDTSHPEIIDRINVRRLMSIRFFFFLIRLLALHTRASRTLFNIYTILAITLLASIYTNVKM